VALFAKLVLDGEESPMKRIGLKSEKNRSAAESQKISEKVQNFRKRTTIVSIF